MLQIERHRLICSHIQQQGSALVQELADLCMVSKETIRRDLTILEHNNKLTRSFGGAVALENTHLLTTRLNMQDGIYNSSMDKAKPFSLRMSENPEIKIKIAKYALRYINAGDYILLDNSSSCWFLARQIPDIELTVLTNSIRIIQILSSRSKIKVIGIGGEYSEKHEDFHGPLAELALRNHRINTLFFSCQSINSAFELRDNTDVNVKLKQVMLQVSDKKIALIDESKFDKYAFCKICSLTDIDLLITNSLGASEYNQKGFNTVVID